MTLLQRPTTNSPVPDAEVPVTCPVMPGNERPVQRFLRSGKAWIVAVNRVN
jgi:hypothetical protein